MTSELLARGARCAKSLTETRQKGTAQRTGKSECLTERRGRGNAHTDVIIGFDPLRARSSGELMRSDGQITRAPSSPRGVPPPSDPVLLPIRIAITRYL